jgi:hypothetical protein
MSDRDGFLDEVVESLAAAVRREQLRVLLKGGRLAVRDG